MANLTLTIDEEVLRRARIRAIEQSTSVNAIVREFLESYAGTNKKDEALREFLNQAKQSRAGSGPEGRIWKREDIYEERLGRYGQR